MRGSILVIDDEEIIREALEALLVVEGYNVATAATAEQGLDALSGRQVDTVLLDLMLPDRNGLDVLDDIRRTDEDLPVVMVTAFGTIESAIAATKLGAFHFVQKPFKNDEVLAVLRNAIERRRLVRENRELRDRLRSDSHRYDEIIGGSSKMKAVYDLISRAAPSRTTVLVQGSSGTGKELVARAFHRRSARSDKPFITVNSGSLPPDLLESNLFGHVKGAFTGAVYPKKGLFELADKGTIFFDEIGNIPADTQSKLLRVIQEREFMRLGGVETIKVDVRIIAATNVNLRELMGAGDFREDLFYRLNVVPMRLPPLRERIEDIPDLVRHFLRKTEANGLKLKRLEPAAVERLKGHTWPGNVRELENLIRRLVVLNPDEVIPEEAVAAELVQLERTMPAAQDEETSLNTMVERYLAKHFAEYGERLPPAGLYDRVIREVERPLVSISLAAARGNQIRAAQLLGLNRNTLRKKIRELGVEVIRGLKSY